jgi:hypothetical protein
VVYGQGPADWQALLFVLKYPIGINGWDKADDKAHDGQRRQNNIGWNKKTGDRQRKTGPEPQSSRQSMGPAPVVVIAKGPGQTEAGEIIGKMKGWSSPFVWDRYGEGCGVVIIALRRHPQGLSRESIAEIYRLSGPPLTSR